MSLEAVWPDIERLAATGESANMMSAAQLLVMTAFGDQRRYDGLSPMWVHSTRVGLQVNRWGGDLSTTLAGFCHDLLEDTNVTAEYVEGLFGRDTLEITRACTLNEALYDQDHKRGNDELRSRVKAAGKRAVLVKVADIDDNLDFSSFCTVPSHWQEEMLYCAKGWLDLGRQYLGVNPGVESLRLKLDAIERWNNS
jgi:(p)ppGpp synthase/HD superfamily hydrolase